MMRKYPGRYDPAKWVDFVLLMFEGKYLNLGFVNSACSLVIVIF